MMTANVTSQSDSAVRTELQCQDMYVSGSTSPGLVSTASNEVPTYVVAEVTDAGDIQVQTTQSSVEVDAITDGPFCLVCNDKGSGYHYSVYSCEGCKGFFKRSVQKCLAYTCKENSDCIINKYTRNSCQHCRFKKCVEVGMRRDAVREDRTPGGKHRHKRPRIEDGGAKPSTMSEIMSSVAPQPLTPKCTITTTLILPQEPYDDALVQRLIDASPDLYPSNEVVPPEGMAQMDINDLMQYGYIELRFIIDWARKVPGFSDLLIEDQMALLKASFMELNVLRLSFRSLDCDGRVKFAKGVIMAPSESSHIGWGSDLINCTLEFIGRLKDVQFDKTEFSILNAIVLTYPDAAGVQDKGAITALQCQILDSLRKYVIRTYPNEPRRYGKILLRLPALRSISAKAAERFLSMSLDGSVKMNALVLEIMS